MAGESAWEADFSISCAQCGGQEFREIFPVPAEIYRAYRAYRSGAGQEVLYELVASVYACVQCGHLEKFVDWGEGDGAPGVGEKPG
jgi:hypothetical protein